MGEFHHSRFDQIPAALTQLSPTRDHPCGPRRSGGPSRRCVTLLKSFAYTFRCCEGQIDICIKTTTPSQLGTLRRKIDELEAEILDIKKALAAAQAPADIAFLRQRLGDLDKKEILLLE
ncbi:TPA: hypothetical protein ACH3X1_014440 [Trebouxia sp. C0004]